MELTFLGATGTVTGSKYCLQIGGKRVLIDCGLFQGYKPLRLRNWESLPIHPRKIDAVLLTHAHIDHSGYIPLLVRNGFTGPIYCTKATFALCSVLLPDSGHIHEEDAKRANRYGYTKHTPAFPLYTVADAQFALQQFVPIEFNKTYQITEELIAEFHHAGHIFGASCVRCTAEGTDIVFTGDLGRPSDPIMKPPEPLRKTDILICEATYGDRLHDKSNPKDKIGEIIRATVKRGGSILIPAFAVGRAQVILYYLYQLKIDNAIADVPIYLDSPMAIDATKIMVDFAKEHRLSKQQCIDICRIATYTNTVEDSKAIHAHNVPKIIISASGMAEGGRVLHHLKYIAPEHRNTILFTGYQAGGTRGDAMLRGKSEVKIHGQMVSVRAQIEQLTNTSAHADYQEIIDWLRPLKTAPRQVYLTHGEPDSVLVMKKHIEQQLGWAVTVPEYMEVVKI